MLQRADNTTSLLSPVLTLQEALAVLGVHVTALGVDALPDLLSEVVEPIVGHLKHPAA